LAAIFAADVAGYSRLMGQDEVGTLRTLAAHREVMDRLIAEHGGRIANTAGDSVLAEFPSAVDAVQCAVEVQKALGGIDAGGDPEKALRFRIGIHVGDVMVRGGDLLGDGVNIAARLESLAEPGGVCLSGDAHRQVRKALALTYTDLGIQQVKNIEEPVQAFSVGVTTLLASASLLPKSVDQSRTLPLPDKPSIAVLPFTNMSGDPEQEYFADGIVEDIITALSRFKWLFIIARNSSFTYKGRAVDIRQVGRELGVRYVLEGSIRKAGQRVRITGQLIEAETGHHVWADRIDGGLEDVFELQDQVTRSIVGAVEPSVRQAEIARSRIQRPNSLNAYDLYLRALPHLSTNTPEATEKALALLRSALSSDPDYTVAQAHLSWCYEQRFQRSSRDPSDRAEAIRLARMVIGSATNDALALAIAGFVLTILARDYESALGAVDRSLALNADEALALGFNSITNALAGRYEAAIEHGERALRLSPFDPMNYHPLLGMGFAYFFLGLPAEASVMASRAIQTNPSFVVSYALAIASLVKMGQKEAAAAAVSRLHEVAPGFTVAAVERMALAAPEQFTAFCAALREGGLPE
jgi:TolB-like protein/class 3 adenylate cyclase